MPITPTTEYLKVTYGGSAWDEQEIWSIGLHLAMVDGTSVEQALADFDLAAAAAAFATTMNTAEQPTLSSGVTFNEVRVARFNIRGKQQGDSRVFFPAAPVTGNDTRPYIPQHSVVVTLLSDQLRGKTSKGRFYLPAGYGLPEDDGYLSDASVGLLKLQVSNFLNELSDVVTDTDPDLRIANVSGYTPTFEGASNPVVAFSIGNVVDTQRRRRNGLKERYNRGDLA